jgi:hypothetical protein
MLRVKIKRGVQQLLHLAIGQVLGDDVSDIGVILILHYATVCAYQIAKLSR